MLGSTLLDDGMKGAQYRFWVEQFKVNQNLTPNGEVDSPTQDALMTRNWNYGDYVEWVQRALNRSGETEGKLPVSGKWNDATSDAVRDFQNNEGLVVDGFVGSKTETALLMRTGIRVPGRLMTATPYRPKRPDPHVWRDSLAPGLRMNVWLNAMIIERTHAGTASPRQLCMMQKLAANSGGLSAFAYLTLDSITKYAGLAWPPPTPIVEFAENAFAELHKKTRQMQRYATYALAWEGFQSEVLQIEKHIADGLVALKASTMAESIKFPLQPMRELRNWVELRQEKSWSILYCFGMNVG